MAFDSYHFFQDAVAGKVNEIYDYAPVFDSTGSFKRVSGIDVLINSLRTLLMTPLGYYPFDPEYGSLLYKKLFEMSDTQTLNEIDYEVKARVRRYDNRIKIDSVTISFSPDKKTAIVNVIINRNGITGTVTTVLTAQNTMFGLEDAITAAYNE